MDAVSPVLDHFGRPYRNGDKPRDWMPSPYPLSFASMYTGPDGANWHGRFDEAMRTRRTDALAMKKDDFLQGLMQERKLAVSCLPWHLEIPNEKDPVQVHVRDAIDKTIRDIDELEWIFQALLEAIWYGRYGVQIKWRWGQQEQYRVLTVHDWDPVNGDKIGHQQDRTPYILINGAQASTIPGAKIIHATVSQALSLRGQWRQNFIIHKNEVNDADFFRGEEAEGRWGVGVRSNLYWPWWLRQELREWGTTFFERVGLGMTVWYYDLGNPTALEAAKKAAKEQSRRTNLFVPIPSDGKGNGKGWVERIDTPVAGSEAIGKMIEGLESHMERYVVGQEASSKSSGSTGLGNQAGAELQASTKFNITRRDAKYFQTTLTGSDLNPGLVWMIQRYSFPETMPGHPGSFRVRLVFDLENPESEEKLRSAKTMLDMGINLKADEVRGAGGFSKPAEGDEVIEPPEQPGAEGGAPPGPGGDPGGGNPLAALMDGEAPEGEKDEGQEQEPGDFLASLRGESAAMQRELAAYYAWENRGKAKDGKKNIWYDPDTKQRRVQIIEPGSRKPKGTEEPAGKARAAAKPKAAKAAKSTVDEVGDFLTGLNRDQITPELAQETAKGLASMTVPELKALKTKLGLDIKGKMVKSDLAKKIAEKALTRGPDSIDLGGMEALPEHMPEHWAALAGQAGVSPHDLHKAALEIHSKDAQAKTEQSKGIWIAQHYGANAGKLREAYASKDQGYINKFRNIAERIGPLMFPGGKHFEAHLYNALAEGPPAPMSQDAAYQQAMEELQGKQPEQSAAAAEAAPPTPQQAPAAAPSPPVQPAKPQANVANGTNDIDKIAVGAVEKWKKEFGTADMPVDKLYDQMKSSHPDLKPADYRKMLVGLHRKDEIRLSGWSGPLSRIPDKSIAVTHGEVNGTVSSANEEDHEKRLSEALKRGERVYCFVHDNAYAKSLQPQATSPASASSPGKQAEKPTATTAPPTQAPQPPAAKPVAAPKAAPPSVQEAHASFHGILDKIAGGGVTGKQIDDAVAGFGKMPVAQLGELLKTLNLQGKAKNRADAVSKIKQVLDSQLEMWVRTHHGYTGGQQ